MFTAIKLQGIPTTSPELPGITHLYRTLLWSLDGRGHGDGITDSGLQKLLERIANRPWVGEEGGSVGRGSTGASNGSIWLVLTIRVETGGAMNNLVWVVWLVIDTNINYPYYFSCNCIQYYIFGFCYGSLSDLVKSMQWFRNWLFLNACHVVTEENSWSVSFLSGLVVVLCMISIYM